MNINHIVYDIEIIKAIPQRGVERIEGIEYCDGWDDVRNMGISVIGVFDSTPGLPYPLTAYIPDEDVDSLRDAVRSELGHDVRPKSKFEAVAKEAEAIVSFNGINFDDRVCVAEGIAIKTTYDLLCECFVASGQPPFYRKGFTRAGYGLDNIAKANVGRGKTGHGAIAPVQWQQGDKLEVIRYCLDDVHLTAKLFEERRSLIDPTTNQSMICSASPWASEAYYAGRGNR